MFSILDDGPEGNQGAGNLKYFIFIGLYFGFSFYWIFIDNNFFALLKLAFCKGANKLLAYH